MTMKDKYLGKRKIELEQDLNLPPDTEVLFIIEEIKPIKDPIKDPTSITKKQKEENPWDEIIKISKPAGRSDLSVRHHEILGDLIE